MSAVGWTYCSGIGAPEMAAPWVDWRLASEIEPFPRAVLQERFGYKLPEDHNQGEPLLWSDMTEVDPDLARARGVPLPDIVVAGTPCQAFSVAGLRRGTADDRGNLTLRFVENVHAIVADRPDGKLVVLWENVPGVLSDKGNAFGCFLGGLVGSDDPLSPPRGEGWPGAGMVSGPRARVAWRVLDAQYFGVAQRRRRVFVVVDFGGVVDPAAVLFERQGLRGNTPPRREARQGFAPTLAARSRGGGGLGTDTELDGGLIPSHDPACTLTAREKKGALPEADLSTVIAHTLKGEGFDGSEDGTGRGTPLVPVAFHNRQDPDVSGNVTHPLGAKDNGLAVAFSAIDNGQDASSGVTPTLRKGGDGGQGQALAVAFAQNQRDEVREMDKAGALAAEPGAKQQTYVAQPVVAFQERGREGGRSLEHQQEVAYALTSPSGGGRAQERCIADPWAVRRLTPVECERLQGFPDGHTAISWRGKAPEDCPDGPRYKALGNSMAVPNIAWIMDRIREQMK